MKERFNIRSAVAACHDAVMAGASFLLALYIRLGDEEIYLASDYALEGTLLFTGICFGVFNAMRLYRGLWRFASMRDIVMIVRAVSLAVLLFAVVMSIVTRLDHVPRSVFFINWMLLIGMLSVPRFVYRSLKDRTLFWEMTLEEKAKIPVLLIGATRLAEQFIQDMKRDPRTSYRVVGILDNDATQHHRLLERTRIYGNIETLPGVIETLNRKNAQPHKILIADNTLSGEQIQNIMQMADRAALPVARIPRLSEFQQHFDAQAQIQPIALEDLLGRPQNALDKKAMGALITGKRVFVTGAGGSIGSELVRQIASFDPKSLILLDSSEFNLYEIAREAGKRHNNIHATLGDVRDTALLNQQFSQHKPDIVFHAAAVKHVPIAEENAAETILTNIFGTKAVADACAAHKVGSMVLISTDKAVNPTSIMGATKKLAEVYCQTLARQKNIETCFVTVRFGNVLGSTGSVVPLFAEQIKAGGPITITHAEMTRYFMTIREAVELVLQAASIGTGMQDRRDHIFVLDMGKPIKILDLALQMLKLAGLKPNEDIAIRFTGLRPGEKLHEELFHTEESPEKTAHASIFLASSRTNDYSDFSLALEKLKAAAAARHDTEAVALLGSLVPEFKNLPNVA